MKKALVILFAALFVCVFFPGCALRQGSEESQTSDGAGDASGAGHGEQREFSFLYFDGPDGRLPDHSSVFYGEFSGCGVRFNAGQACVVSETEVEGYKFLFGSSFSITVGKDGEEYDLKDAYENALLTKDDIAELYEIHKEFVTRYYMN